MLHLLIPPPSSQKQLPPSPTVCCLLQELQPGNRLISLPPSCQLSFGPSSSPELLGVISQVPEELWGGRLAMQVIAAPVRGASRCDS